MFLAACPRMSQLLWDNKSTSTLIAPQLRAGPGSTTEHQWMLSNNTNYKKTIYYNRKISKGIHLIGSGYILRTFNRASSSASNFSTKAGISFFTVSAPKKQSVLRDVVIHYSASMTHQFLSWHTSQWHNEHYNVLHQLCQRTEYAVTTCKILTVLWYNISRSL